MASTAARSSHKRKSGRVKPPLHFAKSLTPPPPISRSHLLSIVQDPRTSKPLKEGEVIRMWDGTPHLVQYVNHAGAYIIPLAGVNREIAGGVVVFNAGGKTISATSIVERMNPLALGGNSPEFKRYVKMVASLGKEGVGALLMEDIAGVGFGDFDAADVTDPGSEAEAIIAAGGRTVSAESLITSKGKGQDSMAKKAKGSKGNGAVKARAKVPKTVRNCVCGCGEETSGHFAPGHDARYHGWIKKLADGRIQRNGKDTKSGEQVVGAALLNKMGLSAKGEGFKAATPEFYRD